MSVIKHMEDSPHAAGETRTRAPATGAASSGKPQKFMAGFAPFTIGSVETYWSNCDECSRVGFHTIEVWNSRIRLAETYADRTSEFRDEMDKRRLRLVGVNQSHTLLDFSKNDDVRAIDRIIGKFLQGIGARYTGWESPVGDKEDELRAVARFANEEGKRLWEENGIRLCYHTNSAIGFRRLLDLTNPQFVHLSADLGWLTRGGADALEVCRAYRSRLAAVHLKDFDPNVEYEDKGQRQKGGMVVIGKGVVDFPAVVEFLRESEFDGFVLGELGVGVFAGVRSPEPISVYAAFKEYMTETLRLQI